MCHIERRLDYPLNRLFDDDFFRFPPSLFPTWKTRASEMTPALSTFKVDVTENDKGYMVNCDLPGMSKEVSQPAPPHARAMYDTCCPLSWHAMP